MRKKNEMAPKSYMELAKVKVCEKKGTLINI